jgi:hypothetical protein
MEKIILTEELAEKISKYNELTEEEREQIIEEIRRPLLSKEEKMLLRRPTVRREMLKRCGKKAFLIPEELKFPIVSPLSKNCEPDCRLLFAAYLRANEWKRKKPEYEKVAQKAKEMYLKMGCANKIKVQLGENEMTVEEFMELFEV